MMRVHRVVNKGAVYHMIFTHTFTTRMIAEMCYNQCLQGLLVRLIYIGRITLGQ